MKHPRDTLLVLSALGFLALCTAYTVGFIGALAHGDSEPADIADTSAGGADIPDATASPAPRQTIEDPLDAELVAAARFKQEVQDLVESLSLEEKIAQMFIVSTSQLGSFADAGYEPSPGGVIFFAGDLSGPEETKALLADIQNQALAGSGIPLFLAVDEEGGTVARVASNAAFSVDNVGNMAAIGNTGDAAQARAAATYIGSYLADLGFNLDFAPVADIAGSSDYSQDVMAKRSFSTDAKTVTAMVAAQVQGFMESGVLCAAKHFPGIGGVEGDSHSQAIYSHKTLDELREWELVPFRAAIEAGTELIMVGHLSLPEALGNSIPASINEAVVSGLLREELGFAGLIITDSMGMGALTDYVAQEQVGVAAILAGVDVVLMPPDFPGAYQAVLDAVQEGILSEERIDASVERIVAVKLRYLEW